MNLQPTHTAMHPLRPWLTALLMLIVSVTAQAETATNAITAAAADTATTAVGLASGLTELNPLGLAGTVVIKIATITYIHQLPEEDQAHPYGVLSAFWGGAAANNLCWLTGAGPLCLALGIATGSFLWNSGTEDRHYWASCKTQRMDHPETPCSRSNKNLNRNAEPSLAQAP